MKRRTNLALDSDAPEAARQRRVNSGRNMSRLLISSIGLLLSIIMLPTSSISSETPSMTRQLGLRIKTIYIDPWYGGKEFGPRLSKTTYAKDVTLEIATKMKGQLEASGFNVYLSRQDDHFIPVEKRTVQARQNGVDIYLKIKISNRKKDCISISLPPLMVSKEPSDPKKKEELNTELDRIVADLKKDDKIEESVMIANSIAKKLKSGSNSGCLQLVRRFDYVLLETPMPAVSIDFGVSLASKKQSYILDATIQNNIVQALADAIKAYVDERVPKNDSAM